MYRVNTIKSAILYGNAFIHLKSRITDLKMYQMHDLLRFLLHEISHNYKILYIAFLQLNLPRPHLKIQGSN